MKGSSAALVDVMSFLFLLALVIFVTSTEGQIEQPGETPRFLSVSVTPLLTAGDRFELHCNPPVLQRSDDLRLEEVVFSVFVVTEAGFEPVGSISEVCYDGAASGGESAVLRASIDGEVNVEAILILPSNIGTPSRLGTPLPMEVQIIGTEFCAQASLDPLVGRMPPFVLQPSGSCA